MHRQRCDGGRARRRARRPRSDTVLAGPAGRLVPAGHRGRGLSPRLARHTGRRSRACTGSPSHPETLQDRRARRTPSSRPTRSGRSPTGRPGRPAPARGWRPPTRPPGRSPGPSPWSDDRTADCRQVVHRDHAVADRRRGTPGRPGSARSSGEKDISVFLQVSKPWNSPPPEQLRAGAEVADLGVADAQPGLGGVGEHRGSCRRGSGSVRRST